ncbi:MAG: circularly permuted type 2 ATP-grasp protein, partial [Rhodospirillaceae bacterium]
MGSAPFDEMNAFNGKVRKPYAQYSDWLKSVSTDHLSKRHAQADMLFRRIGITFAVYGQNEGGERLIPFDVIPRIISPDEWNVISKGVIQRVDALNMFLHDIYHKQEIVKAGHVPRSLIKNNDQFRKEMVNFDPPGGKYVQIAGVD